MDAGILRLAALVLLALVAACAANVRPVTFPNGTTGYSIGCSGVQRSMADCEAKARALCAGGYETVSSLSGGPGAYQYQRLISVRCKA